MFNYLRIEFVVMRLCAMDVGYPFVPLSIKYSRLIWVDYLVALPFSTNMTLYSAFFNVSMIGMLILYQIL